MAKGSRGGKRASSATFGINVQTSTSNHNPYEPDYSHVNTDNYSVPFNNPYLGSVSRVTAGQVYKANKNGDIEVLPETIKTLYDEANDYSSLAIKRQRYNQDYAYYDRLDKLTYALLNNDYKSAQHLINQLEYDKIKLAGNKSVYYKYKSKLKGD